MCSGPYRSNLLCKGPASIITSKQSAGLLKLMLWLGVSSSNTLPPASSNLAVMSLSHPLHSAHMSCSDAKHAETSRSLLGSDSMPCCTLRGCIAEVCQGPPSPHAGRNVRANGAHGGTTSCPLRSPGSVSALNPISRCPSAGGQYATASSPPGASAASQLSST
jgi:hypothetical protein